MAQAAKTKAEAPFTRSNAKKCICWECPVQAESACIRANSDEMGDVMTAKAFTPEIVPGLYCSSGVASCRDLNPDKACICGGCQVYGDYELAAGQPTDHYCENGAQ